jgi:uncharacterized membrane protein
MLDLILIAQEVPQYGAYELLMLASRILHILGAIILVGGLFYLWAVVTPSSAAPVREALVESSAVDTFFGGNRASWAKWVGIASLFLVVTGLWNFVSMVTANKLHFTYHVLGLVKILLGLALMAIAALLAGRTTTADSIRRKWRKWLSIAVSIGIITAMVGSVMRTYPRTLKLDAPPETTVIAP